MTDQRAVDALLAEMDRRGDMGDGVSAATWRQAARLTRTTLDAVPATGPDTTLLSHVGVGSIRRCVNPLCDVPWSQPHKPDCGVGRFLAALATPATGPNPAPRQQAKTVEPLQWSGANGGHALATPATGPDVRGRNLPDHIGEQHAGSERDAYRAGYAAALATPAREGLDVERVHRITCKRVVEHKAGSENPYHWPCTVFAREYAALSEPSDD